MQVLLEVVLPVMRSFATWGDVLGGHSLFICGWMCTHNTRCGSPPAPHTSGGYFGSQPSSTTTQYITNQVQTPPHPGEAHHDDKVKVKGSRRDRPD